MKRSKNQIIIASIIVVGFLIWLGLSIDTDAILEKFSSVKWDQMLIGSVFMLVGMQIIPVRWYLLQEDRQGFVHSYQTTAITFLERMFLPIAITLLRFATVTLTTEITVPQIAPAIIAERIVETLMRVAALVLFVYAFGDQTEWALLWILVLLALFAGFVSVVTRFEKYFPRMANWLNRKRLVRSQRLRRVLSSLRYGIATISSPHRLVFSLLFSLVMGFFFMAGYAWMFKAVGLSGDLWKLLALASGLVFLLPPSTSQMFLLYVIMIEALVIPVKIMDVNTALVFGILVVGIQMIFWLLTGIWGLTHMHLRFKEILQSLDEIRDQFTQDVDNGVDHGGEIHPFVGHIKQ